LDNQGNFVSQNVTVGLSGAQSSFAAGNIKEFDQDYLTGSSMTASTGTITTGISCVIGLTGSQATTSTGTLWQSLSAFQDYCWEGYFVTGYVPGTQVAMPNGLTATQDAWLEAIARIHGAVDGYTITTTDTTRSDGVLTQSIITTDTYTTLAPITLPAGTSSITGITPRQLQLLESLARVHGLIDPLTTSMTTRSDGVLNQSITSTDVVFTITKV